MASIIDGVYEIIDEALDVTDIGERSPHHKNKTACARVCNGDPLKFDCSEMLERILSQMRMNFDNSETSVSKELWRFEKQDDDYDSAVGPETRLEKDIVKNTDGSWVNQVPTSSGLVGGKSDGKRNIDIVRCDSVLDREYTFYELKVKVKSGHPLFAAMEIVIYGVLYCLARHLNTDRLVKFPNSRDLLSAKSIRLRVLAPQAYYDPFLPKGLQNLTNKINDGISGFLKNKPDLCFEMNFGFDQFRDDFTGFEKLDDYPSLVHEIRPLLND